MILNPGDLVKIIGSFGIRYGIVDDSSDDYCLISGCVDILPNNLDNIKNIKIEEKIK